MRIYIYIYTSKQLTFSRRMIVCRTIGKIPTSGSRILDGLKIIDHETRLASKTHAMPRIPDEGTARCTAAGDHGTVSSSSLRRTGALLWTSTTSSGISITNAETVITITIIIVIVVGIDKVVLFVIALLSESKVEGRWEWVAERTRVTPTMVRRGFRRPQFLIVGIG